jgi:Flp pilus assembly protein TadG
MRMRIRKRGRRGSTLIEFALIAVLLFVVIFAVFEFTRFALVYTTLAQAAKAATRYAIVHGANRTGVSGTDPESKPGATTHVEDVVRYYAGAGLINTAALPAACGSPQPAGICVTYPDGNSNEEGNRVSVTVTYQYDPFVALPINVKVRARSQGVIVF